MSSEDQEVEKRIFLIIADSPGTLDVNFKDLVKARNMQRTFMLVNYMPKTGAGITTPLPKQLPDT